MPAGTAAPEGQAAAEGAPDNALALLHLNMTSRWLESRGFTLPSVECRVSEVRCCTEGGEAPGWQGATTKNTGSI